MSQLPTTDPTRIYPTLRYRDAAAMIRWLQDAFAFTVHADYRDDDGSVVHAQLAYGSGMVMLSQVRDSDYDRLLSTPGDGALPTGCVYIAVDDVDAHHDRARAAGAEIVMPLADQPYGSRDFSCRDPEGYLWSFGTYWPKASEAPSEG